MIYLSAHKRVLSRSLLPQRRHGPLAGCRRPLRRLAWFLIHLAPSLTPRRLHRSPHLPFRPHRQRRRRRPGRSSLWICPLLTLLLGLLWTCRRHLHLSTRKGRERRGESWHEHTCSRRLAVQSLLWCAQNALNDILSPSRPNDYVKL